MSKSPALKLPLLLAAALLLAGCGRDLAASPASTARTAAPSQGSSSGTVQDLGAAEFQALASKTDGIYLDVRHPMEISRGYIADASMVNIADGDFDKKVSRMQKDKAIFVYCASGYRSAAAARKLKALGFATVYNLSGGIGAWKRAGLPVARGEVAKAHADGMSAADFDRLLASEKLLLIDFHTPWCAPCKRMVPVVDALAAEYVGKAKVMRVDIDRAEALATRERIEGVPVFVLYQAGKEVWRHSGEVKASVLRERLNAAL